MFNIFSQSSSPEHQKIQKLINNLSSWTDNAKIEATSKLYQEFLFDTRDFRYDGTGFNKYDNERKLFLNRSIEDNSHQKYYWEKYESLKKELDAKQLRQKNHNQKACTARYLFISLGGVKEVLKLSNNLNENIKSQAGHLMFLLMSSAEGYDNASAIDALIDLLKGSNVKIKIRALEYLKSALNYDHCLDDSNRLKSDSIYLKYLQKFLPYLMHLLNEHDSNVKYAAINEFFSMASLLIPNYYYSQTLFQTYDLKEETFKEVMTYLVKLLDESNIDVQRKCLQILKMPATTDQYAKYTQSLTQTAVENSGGLVALINMLSSSDIRIKNDVLETIQCIVRNHNENKASLKQLIEQKKLNEKIKNQILFYHDPKIKLSVIVNLGLKESSVDYKHIHSMIALRNGLLVSGSLDYQIRLWNLQTHSCETVLSGHCSYVCSLAELNDGRLASADESGQIRIWNLQTKNCDWVSSSGGYRGGYSAPVQLMVLSTGHLVAGYYDGGIFIIHDSHRLIGQHRNTIRKEEELKDVPLERRGFSRVTSLGELSDGRLASGSCNDDAIRIWNIKTGICETTLSGHEKGVYSLSVLRDGRIAGAAGDGSVRIWDLQTQTCDIMPLKQSLYDVQQLVELHDGRLASRNSSGVICIWDLKTKIYERVRFGNSHAAKSFVVLNNGCLANACFDNSQKGYLAMIAILDVGSRTILQADDTTIENIPEKTITVSTTTASKIQDTNSVNSNFRSNNSFAPIPVVNQGLPIQNNPVVQISKEKDASLSQEDFIKLIKQLEESEKRFTAFSLEMLNEQLEKLEQLRLSQQQQSLSKDIEILLNEYRKEKILILERKTILLNSTWETYYRTIQIHFSGLMIASLGIGTGYVQISKSKEAKAFKYVMSAIGFAFPSHHASIIASAASDAVNFLDAQARKDFLKKINIFGNTVTEAEILGEEVARLLLRARAHAGKEISPEQADKDAEALIKAILQVSGPIERDKNTAHELVKMILGDIHDCIDKPLSGTVVVDEKSDSANVSLTLTQSKSHQLTNIEHSTSIKDETEFSNLQNTVNDIKKKTKNIDFQIDVTQLSQKLEAMEKKLNRLQPSSTNDVAFSNNSQGQVQVLIKRSGSTHNESSQGRLNENISLEEQMQIMAQELAILKESHLSLIKQSTLAEDEKQYIVDDLTSSQSPSKQISPKEQQFEEQKKYTLFGQTTLSTQQDLKKTEANEKSEIGMLNPKNMMQSFIKSALLEATSQYILFCDTQNGIKNHGGSASRADCQNLNVLAEQELSQQLAQLIQRFDSNTASSKMGAYSLDTFIINALIRKSSQAPLFQEAIEVNQLSVSDKKAIKIPKPLFGIYPDSDVSENCFRREQVRRTLMTMQKKLVDNCKMVETESFDF